MEGPASLRWLLNPADASSRPPKFQAEFPARPAIETGGVSKRLSSSDFSSLFRQPLRAHNDNPGLNDIPTNLDRSIYPESVSQSNKRRFDAIDDRLFGISAEQPKPKFYRNQTAMRAPPNPKLQRCHYTPVSLQPPKGRDIYGKDGSLQCPYTGCPGTFEIFTQYDEMKAHYAQHANQKADSEIRRGHSYPIELENVNGSSFSFAPKTHTPGHWQGDWPPKPANHPRYKANRSAKPAHHTKRRRPSSASQEAYTLPFPIASRSLEPVARTIYDVTHPSRAPLPKAAKTSSHETHGPGRTIYDVQHPTARRSQRLAGKGSGAGAQRKSKLP